MSTRADFYLSHPHNVAPLEWLGSIGMDGSPDTVLSELSVDSAVGIEIASEADWRESVTAVLLAHDEATHPDWGWPWPWDTSITTDYTYVWGPRCGLLIYHYGELEDHQPKLDWPDMSAIKEIRWDVGNAPMVIDRRSGLANPPTAAKNRPKEQA